MTGERTDGGSVAGPAAEAGVAERAAGPAIADGASQREERAGHGRAVASADGVRERAVLLGRQLAAVAGTELRLGWRRRWPAVLVGVLVAFGAMVVAVGGSAPGAAGAERAVASLAILCVYVVPLLALAYGYDAVVGPAERGWLEVLSALPVRREGLLAGAALGRGALLAASVLLGLAVPGAALVALRGPSVWPAVAATLLAAAALALAFCSIAVLLSALARERTHALGAALLAWVWFVLVHDLVALGVLAAFDLPDPAVAATVLANPAAVYRVLVLQALGAGGSAGFTGVFAVDGLSVPVLLVALACWIGGPLATAVALVGRRGRVSGD